METVVVAVVVAVAVVTSKADTASDQGSSQRPMRREGWLLGLVRWMSDEIRKVNLAYCENGCGGSNYSYPRLN